MTHKTAIDTAKNAKKREIKGFSFRIPFILAAALALAGCAGKCFIEDARYLRMKQNFIETGSLQRAEQLMKDEGWTACERNEFRYRLRKDLDLESLPAAPNPVMEIVP